MEHQTQCVFIFDRFVPDVFAQITRIESRSLFVFLFKWFGDVEFPNLIEFINR